LLTHYKNRANFALNPSSDRAFKDYWAKITDLVAYQIDNGDKFIDVVGTIIYTLGPSLWINSSMGDNPDAVVNTEMKDTEVSAQAWKGGGSTPIGSQTLTANTLNQLNIVNAFDAPALADEKKRITEIVLTLNLTGWDHNFFSRFPQSEIASLVAAKIDTLWREAQDMVKRHVPNASLDDYVADLKKATGGLFLSLTAER
jgi:hypothetical protein